MPEENLLKDNNFLEFEGWDNILCHLYTLLLQQRFDRSGLLGCCVCIARRTFPVGMQTADLKT